MGSRHDRKLTETTCPNLAQVLTYALQNPGRFPAHYDVDAAISEYKVLLDMKEDYMKLKQQEKDSETHRSSMVEPSPLQAGSIAPIHTKLQASSDDVTAITTMTEITSLEPSQSKAGMKGDNEEIKRLTETISYQDMKIAELTTRLSAFASKQMSQGNPDITDLSDSNRPSKLGEKFAELYDNEWSDAYEELKQTMPNEEDTLYTLLRVVRKSYDFCVELAEEQLQRLISSLDNTLQNTLHYDKASGMKYQCCIMFTEQQRNKHFSGSLKFAKEFRQKYAVDITPAVLKYFTDLVIPQLFAAGVRPLSESMNAYIKACVELIWLMVVQDPPMVIRVPKPSSPIDADTYRCYSKKGKTVKEPVWPAVLLYEGGTLISKGYVLPA